MADNEDGDDEDRASANIGMGIVLGLSFGTAIGAATDNLGMWIAVGLALGAGAWPLVDMTAKAWWRK